MLGQQYKVELIVGSSLKHLVESIAQLACKSSMNVYDPLDLTQRRGAAIGLRFWGGAFDDGRDAARLNTSIYEGKLS